MAHDPMLLLLPPTSKTDINFASKIIEKMFAMKKK